MAEDHKRGGYRQGCRCTDCRAKHSAAGLSYYHGLQSELAELRAWRDQVLAGVPGREQVEAGQCLAR